MFCTYKVTRGCRDPICESLRVSQCHLEPSWTPWQSGAVQHYSSSSCGQEPLTPQQTEGNEKRVQQPMAPYSICRETWLILQLCGHCLWMQTIWLQNVGQAKEKKWKKLLRLWGLTKFHYWGFRNSAVLKGESSYLHDCNLQPIPVISIVKCQVSSEKIRSKISK